MWSYSGKVQLGQYTINNFIIDVLGVFKKEISPNW